ncbi:NAD(P)H-dependent oxidoreductase [Kitasatospora sp. NBC_01560]|uniref:NADPH-dependent FMN reductase n=1 Tax=Kitasatospora sp. NBC_01560 TaxID=2975965 RepID=UPI0038672F7B
MPNDDRHILLLPGSLRAGSTNETVLRTAAAVAHAIEGISATYYTGLAGLPHFNPDLDTDPLPEQVAALRAAVEAADALLICTPEYAGTLPGAFKNLLDWTVGGVEISDKPTGWITAAAPGRGGGAEATLRTVLGYTGAAVVDEACVRIPLDRAGVGPDGLATDPLVRDRIGEVLARLAAG